MASEQLSTPAAPVVIDELSTPGSREIEPVSDQGEKESSVGNGSPVDIEHQGSPESFPSTATVQEKTSKESGVIGEEAGREEHMIGQDGPSIREQRIGDEGSSEYEEKGNTEKETGQEEASIKEQDTVLVEASGEDQEGESVIGQVGTGAIDQYRTSENNERLEQEEAHVQEHEGVEEHGKENEIGSGDKPDSEQERIDGDVQEKGGDEGRSAGSGETKRAGVTGLEQIANGEELGDRELLESVRGDTGDHMEENRSEQAAEHQVIIEPDTTPSTQDKGDESDVQGAGTTEHVTRDEGTGAHVEKDVGVNEVEEGSDAGDQVQGGETDLKVTGEMTVSGIQAPADELSEIEQVDAQAAEDDGQVRKDAETATDITVGETDTQIHLKRQDTDVQVTGTDLVTGIGVESGTGEHIIFSGDKKEEFLLTSSVEECTGAQEKLVGKETGADIAGELTSGQVSSSGEKEERQVTPEPTSDPCREGTADSDRPAACWEREGQLLMCTGREVKADTAGQAETQVTCQERDHQTPEMKDREFVEDEEISSSETPIEREIRLAMEREQMLREERGISLPVGQQELVEVRRKAVAGEQGPPADKERQLAGAQMQRDILLESRRELDLVQLGKVKGDYDRGPQQELQEKKMIFESFGSVSTEPVLKKRQSVSPQLVAAEAPISVVPAASNHMSPSAPSTEVKKGPSYAEANGSNVILIEHGSFLRRSVSVNSSAPATASLPRPTQVDSPQTVPGSPFQLLRSPSPRSILEREIEEVQEREKELQRQRSSVYGSDESSVDAKKEPNSRVDVQSGTYQPERPNWRKLEVNWPPNRDVTVNGQQPEQTVESPRTRRQRSALIQSWESGTPNPLDNE